MLPLCCVLRRPAGRRPHLGDPSPRAPGERRRLDGVRAQPDKRLLGHLGASLTPCRASQGPALRSLTSLSYTPPSVQAHIPTKSISSASPLLWRRPLPSRILFSFNFYSSSIPTFPATPVHSSSLSLRQSAFAYSC